MQMKILLVPVDFSTNSDKACRYAMAMAKELKAKVILMHSFESAVLYSKIPLTTMQLDYSYLYNNAVRKLQAYHRKIEKLAGKIEIELSIQQGLPSARIVEMALEKKAYMVVMGTTGKGKAERVMFGSNVIRTILHAPCMVLAVPYKAVFSGFSKIAYATDLTNDNLNHAKLLLPLAEKFKSELMFLNVNEEAEFHEEQVKDIKSKIKKIISYRRISGYVTTDFDVERGISFSAKKHKVDCLAIFTRHRNFLNQLFGTSLARILCLHTTIPMLVIHENDYDPALIESVKQPLVKGKFV